MYSTELLLSIWLIKMTVPDFVLFHLLKYVLCSWRIVCYTTENVRLSEHFVKNVMLKQGISPQPAKGHFGSQLLMQEIYVCTGWLCILPVLGWILFSVRPMPALLWSSNGNRISTFNKFCLRGILWDKCISLHSVSIRIFFRHFLRGSMILGFISFLCCLSAAGGLGEESQTSPLSFSKAWAV